MAFRHLQYFGQKTPSEQVQSNLTWYLRDKLLEVGAYYNISSGTKGYDGVDFSLLKQSNLPQYQNGQFWTGLSHQWIWESGVINSFSGGQSPIEISGLFINGLFVEPESTGQFSYSIDYSRGGVLFNNPVSTGATILCERSERAAFVYEAFSDEYRKITLNHLRDYNYTPGSGEDNYFKENRKYLPALCIDVNLDETKGYELGSLSQHRNYNVDFYIFSEHERDLRKLNDICTSLEGTPIQLFDMNEVIDSNDFPLNHKGNLIDGSRRFPHFSTEYPWRKGYFLENSRSMRLPQLLPVHRSKVSIGFQIII